MKVLHDQFNQTVGGGTAVLPAGSDIIKPRRRIVRRTYKTTETLGKSRKGQRIGQSSKTSSHSSSCASASRERTYWPTHRDTAFRFQCKQMYAFGWKVWHNRKTPCRPTMLLQLLYLLVLGKFKLLNAKMIQVIKKQDSPEEVLEASFNFRLPGFTCQS